jgi:threonine/homoserine/homoserine lactone efflux protein
VLVALGAFTLAAVLIIVMPGPDTLIVIRNMLRGGRRRGAATAVGVLTGLAGWAGAAALGISALLRASHVGYDLLRIAGAAYLIWLGVQTIRSHSTVRPPARGITGTGFPAGLVSNLLNPKVGVFFVTFLPAFVPRGANVGLTSLILGAEFVVLTGVYFALLLALATRVAQWMNTPRVKRRVETVTGTVLVAFGVRLAVER